MCDKNQLNENELNNVVGGGSGIVPSGGINFYESYNELETGYYYCSDPNNVVYLYRIEPRPLMEDQCQATKENFVVEGNSWSSSRYTNLNLAASAFKANYPYRLNVRP